MNHTFSSRVPTMEKYTRLICNHDMRHGRQRSRKPTKPVRMTIFFFFTMGERGARCDTQFECHSKWETTHALNWTTNEN